MNLKERFIKMRDDYVINQVEQVKIPLFRAEKVVRYRVTFSGRVQHVGFRLEVSELAKRLKLTGFCRNLENGDVLAEFQGMENKIRFLLDFMDSLKRIRIRKKRIQKLELIKDEAGFETRQGPELNADRIIGSIGSHNFP